MSLIWIFKLAVTPLLVAAASLAARRWGPRIGGILIGFPVMTGPISLFLAIEQGVDFAEQATVGILLALVATSGFCIAYVAASASFGPLGSLASASIVFAALAVALVHVTVDVTGAALFAVSTIIAAIGLIGRPDARVRSGPSPWFDLPARMLASACLVGIITASAERLGPLLSGITGTYPVISTVVFTFTHHHMGREATRALVRGMLLSLIAFAACFLVIGLLLKSKGLVTAYGLGILAGGATSATALWLDRLSRDRRTVPGEQSITKSFD